MAGAPGARRAVRHWPCGHKHGCDAAGTEHRVVEVVDEPTISDRGLEAAKSHTERTAFAFWIPGGDSAHRTVGVVACSEARTSPLGLELVQHLRQVRLIALREPTSRDVVRFDITQAALSGGPSRWFKPPQQAKNPQLQGICDFVARRYYVDNGFTTPIEGGASTIGVVQPDKQVGSGRSTGSQRRDGTVTSKQTVRPAELTPASKTPGGFRLVVILTAHFSKIEPNLRLATLCQAPVAIRGRAVPTLERSKRVLALWAPTVRKHVIYGLSSMLMSSALLNSIDSFRPPQCKL